MVVHSPFFFFQAEDGIRDVAVTGVQTCALPIYRPGAVPPGGRERVREGGTHQDRELGADRPAVRRRVQGAGGRARDRRTDGSDVRARLLGAPHRGPRDAARDLAAARDDPDDPALRVSGRLLGAPHLGLDPDLPPDTGCGAVVARPTARPRAARVDQSLTAAWPGRARAR